MTAFESQGHEGTRADELALLLAPLANEVGQPGVATVITEVERIKASIRAKAEHPIRVIKRQFGYVKVRYRGLKKNTAQLTTLFALSNLWMVRRTLLGARA